MEIKTVKGFVAQLPYPYRKLALSQCTNPNQIVPNKIDALEVAFDWKNSNEGWDFWNTHWNNLIDKDIIRQKH